MPIGTAYIAADAYLTCMAHALSTEREEIMGLLLGEVKHESNSPGRGIKSGLGTAHIEGVVILERSDRQADRVEISPLQLSAATQEAEHLSVKLKKPLRVMGWYHSHPHITVFPSHVDVRTQASYQGMDPDFIGLIFSVFQHDDNEKFASASMICFQSEDVHSNLASRQVLTHIVPSAPNTISLHCLQAFANIPQTLFNEENELKERSCKNDDVDPITKIHNSAVFTQALCQLVECCEMPCISALAAYEKSLLLELHALERAKNELMSEASRAAVPHTSHHEDVMSE